MKRLSADDSAGSRVKVGHRQATIQNAPHRKMGGVLLCFNRSIELGTGRPLTGAQRLELIANGAR